MIILTLNQVLLEADRDGADGFTFPRAVMPKRDGLAPSLVQPRFSTAVQLVSV